MEDKKVLQKARILFKKLKTDPASVIFPEELLDNRLLKKLKKLNYEVDKKLLKLINLADKKTFLNDKAPTRTDYAEKREIDRSTLYSFDGPFQLLQADVGNLEFVEKMPLFRNMCLLLLTCIHLKFTPNR